MNKLSVLLSLAIIFFLGAFLFFNFINGQNTAQNKEGVTSEQELAQNSLRDPQADTDGDGLKNWEEDLYGTSKKSTDSDGDGVSDGQEVSFGTDPTLYGAVEHRGEEVVITEKVYDEGFNPTSPDVDINAIQNLLSGKETLESPEQIADLIGIDISQFTNLDNKEAGDVDHRRLKDDLNKTAVIVENSIIVNELDNEEILAFVQGRNSSTYAVERLAEANTEAYSKMSELWQKADPDLQGYVALFAKQYKIMGDSLLRILEIPPTDGANNESVAEWYKYGDANSQWVETMVLMNTFVKSKGIVFSSSEPGHVFMFELAQ